MVKVHGNGDDIVFDGFGRPKSALLATLLPHHTFARASHQPPLIPRRALLQVSRYGGVYEHVFETVLGGIMIQAPQMEIQTVASGGGSRCFFRSGRFIVGPESVGSEPGPVCYRKGGHLAITDANLGALQGRSVADGPGADGLDGSRVGGGGPAASLPALHASSASPLFRLTFTTPLLFRFLLPGSYWPPDCGRLPQDLWT